MLVAIEFPFQVLSVEEFGIPVLKLGPDDLVGQSVLRIIGPKTDRTMFVSAILGAAKLESVLAQFIVYDLSGEARRAIVSIRPFIHSKCCQVTIEASEALALNDGLYDSHCPFTILGAESPHRIKTVNDSFLDKFGCTLPQTVGQDFSRFQGPDQGAWVLLFDAALRGKMARNLVHTAASLPPAQDDVICVPVVEALNSPIRFILVLFSPKISTSCSDPCPASSNGLPEPRHQLSSHKKIRAGHDFPDTLGCDPALPPGPSHALTCAMTAWGPWSSLAPSFACYTPLPEQLLQQQHAMNGHSDHPPHPGVTRQPATDSTPAEVRRSPGTRDQNPTAPSPHRLQTRSSSAAVANPGWRRR